MKRINKLVIAAVAAAITTTAITTSCKKKSPESGYMTVSMTDAPADFVKVNVDVVGFEIHHEIGGWISLPINQGIYNLLDLRNNVSVILANQVNIPIGKVNQIRLILGANNSLQDSTTTYPLTIPSGSETGLKINIDEVIMSNQNLDLLVDFDAAASIVDKGNGTYSLKPVLKLKKAEYK